MANPAPHEVTAVSTFRASGKTPEFWWPDSGRIEAAAMFHQQSDSTRVLVSLGPSGSVFVVFRGNAQPDNSAVALARDGVLDDPKRTRDVRAKVQRLADAGESGFQVARMAAGDDPAFGIVKTLVLEYLADGKRVTVTGTDPEMILLASWKPSQRVAEVGRGLGGQLCVAAWQPGQYDVRLASGQSRRVTVGSLPAPLEIDGPWVVSFPALSGTPQKVTFPRLISWTEFPDNRVKYFSGTATYRKTFAVPSDALSKQRRHDLDLGDVRAIAQVKLNGKDLGVFWKPPFRADVTCALKPGENQLEVQVTNLWPNRLIGDEQLPEDSQRNPIGTLNAWPEWLQQGKPSPAGPTCQAAPSGTCRSDSNAPGD